MPSFAEATGQSWKLYIRRILTAAAVALTLADISLFRGNPLHLPFRVTNEVYFAVVACWFAWYAAAIRCPRCRHSPAWYQMTHGSASNWQARVETGQVCPVCGFDPSGKDAGGSPGVPAV